ncbi:MAG: histidine kinase [Chitinophagaceae bacterium]
MKQLIFIIACIFSLHSLGAQVQWRDTSVAFSGIQWNNYSTSYIGPGKDSLPVLVAAIPYNGIYGFEDDDMRSAMDMTFTGAAYRFRSHMDMKMEPLYTYDSGAVYFMAPGIFRKNADQYEFRVLLNNETPVRPWSAITSFTDPDFRLNEFSPMFAFLGGYSATWGSYLVAELRRKGHQEILFQTVVYWQPTRPVLMSILTGKELNERMLTLKKNFDFGTDDSDQGKWKKLYPPDQLDSLTGLPKKLKMGAGEKELLLFLRAKIYHHEALEYQLIRNGEVMTDWKPNDADNNFIWLHDLKYGEYVLNMRFRKQREHTASFPFSIAAEWYQTWWFKAIIALLILGSIGFVVLLVKNRRQRQRIKEEQAKKERFELGLRSIHAQLNPHFIFNALSSIQGLINKKDIDAANRYLADFGKLVRHSLTDNGKMLIPLQVELNTLETYLKLEQLRFEFSFRIVVDEALDTGSIEIPPLLLQPIIENAVLHGVSSMQQEGRIECSLQKKEKDMLVYIRDNGAGFDTQQPAKGYGLKLTKDRISLLNEQFEEQQIALHFDSDKGKGTLVTVVFKNWLT